MAAFTLAHLSDPHLPPLPAPRLIDLAGKRALGYLNWTRNRHKYQKRDVLDTLVSDMQAQGPDHIAVTGDLVNLAGGHLGTPDRDLPGACYFTCHPNLLLVRGDDLGTALLLASEAVHPLAPGSGRPLGTRDKHG